MICDWYDVESEPIVSFEAFYGEKRQIVEKCIVLFSKTIYDHLLQENDCTQIAEIGACNGAISVWTFENKGETIAFYLSPIGSALALRAPAASSGWKISRRSLCPPTV